jgi:hypothetical protein
MTEDVRLYTDGDPFRLAKVYFFYIIVKANCVYLYM